MKGSDKAIVLGVLMAIVLGFFYFSVLSPKRQKASQLGKDVSDLKSQVSQQEQSAQFGEQARSEFPVFYGRLVVMGKAVPAQADTSSLLVELSAISRRTGVDFKGITLGSSGSGGSSSSSTAAPSSGSPTTGTSTTPTTGSSSTSSSSTATPASTSSASATESTAANLPLGASIGPDNLAVMPYSLDFSGSYFGVADFLKALDDLIHVHGNSTVGADGRLLTVNGFSLSPDQNGNPSNPTLQVSIDVTSYVTPASEGLTAGATPSGPAPSVTTTPTQPASAPVSP